VSALLSTEGRRGGGEEEARKRYGRWAEAVCGGACGRVRDGHLEVEEGVDGWGRGVRDREMVGGGDGPGAMLGQMKETGRMKGHKLGRGKRGDGLGSSLF
jgi:hypothetical protein